MQKDEKDFEGMQRKNRRNLSTETKRDNIREDFASKFHDKRNKNARKKKKIEVGMKIERNGIGINHEKEGKKFQ